MTPGHGTTLTPIPHEQGPQGIVSCGPGPSTPLAPSDRWWAERWLKSASEGERQAMRELLA